MSSCPACNAEVTEFSQFCSACGVPLPVATSTATELAPEELSAAPKKSSSPASRPLSSSSTSDARFAAGTILGERFRIVGLLGRGGMGEVYRADDLTLDQPVALKFLPEEMVSQPSRMQRFLGEVRVARQVAHANVCRVYDIGVVDDHHFISMELVEGDDLVTLLRQVGRFPGEKALEIARQICAGLAAAHDRGIIHRDLKPANVMIDAEGRVRIADFGLASLVGTVEGHDIRSGTPTYMAPEQLAGREVTIQSDIYALGLVLYELFTGKRTHEASSMAELHRLHESQPTSLASHVQDIDPGVERVILRCLAVNPDDRPRTALSVAAALPGGDPLAAALAAGETPSPEMVAAAGSEGKLEPLTAGLLAGGALVLLLICAAMGVSMNAASMLGFEKPPAFLEQRAKDLVAELAFESEVVDEESGIWTDVEYLNHQVKEDESIERWQDLKSGRHSNIYFWFRRSPRALIAHPGFSVVGANNPPMQNSGEAIAWLDIQGRLKRFESIPPQFDESEATETEVDWSRLFEEAEIDPTTFRSTTPLWTPPMNTDQRAAWEGPSPFLPDVSVRIEAGAYRGRPVFFRVIAPWTRPERTRAREQTFGEKVSQIGGLMLMVLVLVVGSILARRNLSLGRGDQKGALRVAFWYFVTHTLVWALWADHVADPVQEVNILRLDVGYNLFLTLTVWVFYVGLEPYVRSRWPDTLIGWSRLLTGHFRDPLVGRDILVGLFGGALATAIFQLGEVLPTWLGWPPLTPTYPNWPEGGFTEILGILLDVPVHALLSVMQVLLFMLIVGIVFRRKWIAVIVCILVFTVLSVGNASYLWLEVPLAILGISVFFYILSQHGLLATAFAVCIINSFGNLPLSTDFGAWYQGFPLAALAVVLALLACGYHTATAGQPLLRDELLDGV